jgi:hypothetical protein
MAILWHIMLCFTDSPRRLWANTRWAPPNRTLRFFRFLLFSIWVWVNTYRYIFSGKNIPLPAILGATRYQGLAPSPYSNICNMFFLGFGGWEVLHFAMWGEDREAKQRFTAGFLRGAAAASEIHIKICAKHASMGCFRLVAASSTRMAGDSFISQCSNCR